MLKPNATTDDLPACFGKSFDSTAPECVGGADPAYVGENGSRVRPTCDHVTACSVRCQASKHGRSLPQPPIPAHNLVRPSTAFSSPPAVQQRSYPHTYSPTYPPTHHYQQQHTGLQQMMPVNFGIPQYLSHREPADGRSIAARLLVEAFRSIFKALGHTISNFFDTETFGRQKPPEGPRT